MTRQGRRLILMDTGPLLALLNRRDNRNAVATEILDVLESENADVSCAYPAALETHRFMLTHGVNIGQAHAMITDALEVFAPVLPTVEDMEEALSSLKRYNDQKISLTDATIAAMARREQRVVFTFDQRQRHFELMGAEVYR